MTTEKLNINDIDLSQIPDECPCCKKSTSMYSSLATDYQMIFSKHTYDFGKTPLYCLRHPKKSSKGKVFGPGKAKIPKGHIKYQNTKHSETISKHPL